MPVAARSGAKPCTTSKPGDRTKVEMTLVDGRKYVPTPEAPPTGGRGGATDGPGVQ